MNKYRALAKDTGLFAIGSFGSKLLSFLIVPLYTSVLTTSDFGNADILSTTIAFVLPIFTLSISEGVLRYCFDADIDKNLLYSIGLRVIILSTIILGGIGTIICVFVDSLWFYLPFFLTIYFLTAIEGLFSNIAKGLGFTSVFAYKGIVYTAVFCISNVLLLLVFPLGLKGYFFSFILAFSFSVAILYIKVIRKLQYQSQYDKQLLRNLLSYSVPFIPAAISWWCNSSFTKYILVYCVGNSANGVFSVAQKIPTIVSIVIGVFSSAWQLSAMSNFTQKDFEDYFEKVRGAVKCILVLTFVAILLSNKLLAECLFKKDFYEAWKLVPILSVGAIFSSLAGFYASIFTSAKKTKSLFYSIFVGAVVNIVLGMILIPYYGTIGAGISVTVGFIVVVVLRLISMKKIIKVRINWSKSSILILVMVSASIVVSLENVPYYLVSIFTGLLICSFFVKEIGSAYKLMIQPTVYKFIKKKIQ